MLNLIQQAIIIHSFRNNNFLVFPGSPVVQTPHFNCWRPGLILVQGNYNPMSHIKWQKSANYFSYVLSAYFVPDINSTKIPESWHQTHEVRSAFPLTDEESEWPEAKHVTQSSRASKWWRSQSRQSESRALTRPTTLLSAVENAKMFPWRSLWAGTILDPAALCQSLCCFKVGMWQDSNPLSIESIRSY